jgi:hypothetical protein
MLFYMWLIDKINTFIFPKHNFITSTKHLISTDMSSVREIQESHILSIINY